MKARVTGATLVLGMVLLVLLTGCGDLSPIASFTCTPSSGAAPLRVSFDASSSYDPDGSITAYEWNFGDGGTGTGEMTSHTYQTAGTYTALLKVTNNDGVSDSADTSIEATESPCLHCVKIIQWHFGLNSRGAPSVTGIARNDCSYPLQYVELFAHFYDADDIEIGTYWHIIAGVLPSEEWDFEIECPISAVWPFVDHASVEVHVCTLASSLQILPMQCR